MAFLGKFGRTWKNADSERFLSLQGIVSKLSSLRKDHWREKCHAQVCSQGTVCFAAFIKLHSHTQQLQDSFEVKENSE